MSDPSNLIPLLYCILNFFFKVLNVCPGLLQRMSFVSDHFLGGKKTRIRGIPTLSDWHFIHVDKSF